MNHWASKAQGSCPWPCQVPWPSPLRSPQGGRPIWFLPTGARLPSWLGFLGGQEFCSHECPTLGVTTVQLVALGLAMERLLLIWSLSDYGDEPLFADLSCVLFNWVGLTSLWTGFYRSLFSWLVLSGLSLGWHPSWSTHPGAGDLHMSALTLTEALWDRIL